MVTAAGVDADVPAADPMVPDKPNELEAENWGGVIASTAPRPPKVPPAINNARFILPTPRSSCPCSYAYLNLSTCELPELFHNSTCGFYSLWKAKASSWKRFLGTPTSEAALRTAVTSGSGPQI